MNEDIKEILYCDMYNDLDSKKYDKLLNYITNLQKENENYKQRNEKAVEYIKNTTLYGFRSGKTLLTNYLDDLLNILEGGDE